MVKRISKKQEEEAPVQQDIEIDEEQAYSEPPLDHEELVTIRWVLFGKCPTCGFYIKDWNSGPFDPVQYKKWENEGRDGVTGHSLTCDDRNWRKYRNFY